ncbi:MAG: hypothetical protein J6S56_03020 [Bacteroidales bacterium]|nr:hypothetical protein [Bacteroidales bacterium]
MKKIVCASAFAVVLIFFSCSKDKIENSQTQLTPQGVPYYSDVTSFMNECGYIQIDPDLLDFNLDEYITPGYINFTVFKDTSRDRLLIPVCYNSRDSLTIASAMSECDHIFSQTYDDQGNTYVTCSGRGNTCHLEISVSPGGSDVSVLIVSCS